MQLAYGILLVAVILLGVWVEEVLDMYFFKKPKAITFYLIFWTLIGVFSPENFAIALSSIIVIFSTRKLTLH